MTRPWSLRTALHYNNYPGVAALSLTGQELRLRGDVGVLAGRRGKCLVWGELKC